jgi:broad specificity phosphatase PhoE
MSVYLVRHAKAGSRRKWEGPDDQRPLSDAGREQAESLADWLADEGIVRIESSPFVRCRQTVEPIAGRLRLPVDLDDSLAEGAPTQGALRLIEKFGDENVVLCTHGDVLNDVLWDVEQGGIAIGDDRIQKAGTWILTPEAGAITRARYVPPPSTP